MNTVESSYYGETEINSIALSKVKDINIFGYSSFTHGFKRTVIDDEVKYNRLEGILKYGLLSSEFAERVGINVVSNWDIKSDRVSANYPSNEAIFEAFGYAVWGSKPYADSTEDLCTLLIQSDEYYKKYPYNNRIQGGPMRNESVWNLRISPRNFEGIVLADIPFNTGVEELDTLTISPIENLLDKVVSTMKRVTRTKPEYSIPIYGTSGNVYWPEKIPYSQIRVKRFYE